MATMTAATMAATTGQRSMPIRPYKDFLTPSLHRRFTNAALAGLIVCWIEATLMSHSICELFWTQIIGSC